MKLSTTVIIGLTGQTGAGKSTVSEFISQMNYRVKIINADSVAREALAAHSDCLKRLAQLFGYDIINSDGSCNRKLLAQKAFSSKENTQLLNQITHPWIIERVKEYILLYQSEKCDIIIFDAPLLFESGGDTLCDTVIAVTAPYEIRLDRIIRRDTMTESEAKLRMKAQHNEEYYSQKANFVIDGSQPLEIVKKQTGETIGKVLYEKTS